MVLYVLLMVIVIFSQINEILSPKVNWSLDLQQALQFVSWCGVNDALLSKNQCQSYELTAMTINAFYEIKIFY